MELYTMTQPSMPLTVPCAPSAWLPMPAAAAVAVSAAPVAVLAAERAPVSWVHQARVQAELAQALLLIDGINGTTGFSGTDVSTKRYADGGSGVPPRGRPV